MQKILISACFLGENVRYNAIVKKLNHDILQQWQQENRLIIQCPEVSAGLPTPRPAAEINTTLQQVITSTGINVTDTLISVQENISVMSKYNIKHALLKESSPSCGSKYIYDGNFTNTKIAGEGVTTKLLRANGICVYSENTINALIHAVSEG